MNEVMENILTRRSVRAFLEKEIPMEELEQIVKAGAYAPSAMNRQTWKFTVLTDREKIGKLAALMAEKLGRADYNMYQPQVLIIPSNEKDYALGKEDNACALENIFLAAHSFGIGSVWINQMRDVCDDEEIRALLTEWEIPENHCVYGMAALGYAAHEGKKDVQKKGEIHFVK